MAKVDDPDDIERLADAAAHVDGVKRIHNLLHTPGSPPKHSPPSDPAEVRERAEQAVASSHFVHNPATAARADEPLVERAAPRDTGAAQ